MKEHERIPQGTYFITGITGFVGSIFTKRLLNSTEYHQGMIKIIGLIRSHEKAAGMYEGFDLSHVQFVEGTLEQVNDELLKQNQINESIDYIVHCASTTQSKVMVANPVETANGIILGTKNMLELARKKQVKSMVYLSSMEVYGKKSVRKERITEEESVDIAPLSVRNCYQLGKAMAENYCSSYYHEYQVPVKIARLAQVFGSGTLPEETRVFAQFADSVIQKKDIVLHTMGESIGNYCSSEDVVEGLLVILEKGKNGEAYNVVNEETTMRIRDMANLVATEIADGLIQVVFDVKDEMAAVYAADTGLRLSSKKLEGLGWSPKQSMRDMYKVMIKEREEMKK